MPSHSIGYHKQRTFLRHHYWIFRYDRDTAILVYVTYTTNICTLCHSKTKWAYQSSNLPSFNVQKTCSERSIMFNQRRTSQVREHKTPQPDNSPQTMFCQSLLAALTKGLSHFQSVDPPNLLHLAHNHPPINPTLTT